MQTDTAFVLLLSSIITSLAVVSEHPHCSVTKSADVSQIPWKFYFKQNDLISLNVKVTNIISPRVIRKQLIVIADGNISFVGKILTNKWLYFSTSYHKNVEVFLEYNTSISSPLPLFVAHGRDVSLVHKEEINKEFEFLNCLEKFKYYTLMVDFKNFNKTIIQTTTEQEKLDPDENENDFMKNETDFNNTNNNSAIGAAQEFSQDSVIIYVLPPIVVSCVLILAIYLGVKKYRQRNSRRAESLELDTCATTNNVEYAELSLAHGDRQALKFNENTPYAKIIGVMKPADRN